MVTTSRKTLVFLVASLLTVILTYSSVAQFQVFAKPKTGSQSCINHGAVYSARTNGMAFGQRCCSTSVGLFSVTTVCQTCYYGDSSYTFQITCDPPESRSQGGNSTLPPSLGTVLPSSSNNTRGLTNGQPSIPGRLGTVLPSSSNNTGTLPAQTSQKLASPNLFSLAPNSTNPTTNTGNPIRMMSSDNPPGCSEKIPIPPNCTLNPFPKSSATPAAGGRSLPGNIINAAPSTGNNSGGATIKIPPGVFGSLGNLKSVFPTGNNTTFTGNNHSSIARATGVYSPTGGCSTGSRNKCIPCDPGIKSPYCIPSDEWPPSSSTSLPLAGNTGIITKVPPVLFKPTGNATNADNNTSTPPASTITKEHNTSTPKVFSPAGNHTNTSNNQQTSGHHHHKGEQNSGTSSTGNSQSGSNNNGNTKSNPSSGGGNNGNNSGSTNNNNNSNNKK